jgi:uncharacterized protein with PIN domain
LIIDTSAIVAVLRLEPDADRFVDALSSAIEPLLSPAPIWRPQSS